MLKIKTPKGWIALSRRENLNVIYGYEGEQELSFDIHTNDSLYPYIQEEAQLQYLDNLFKIKKINQRKINSTINATIDMDNWKVTIFPHYTGNNKQFSEILMDITPEGWTFEQSGIVTKRIDVEFEGVTSYDILMECKELYNIVYEFHSIDKRIKVIKPDTYQTRGLYMSDELNLKEVEFKGDSTDFITRLYAFGKKTEIKDKDGNIVSVTYVNFADLNSGKYYIDNHQYSNKVISAYWQDNKYEDPQLLLDDAIDKLAILAKPTRSYGCKLFDLSRINEKYQSLDFKLYDKVTLIDNMSQLHVVHQIVQYKDYPDNPNLNEVTLSSEFKKIAGTIDGIKQNISSIDTDIKRTDNAINEIVRDVSSNTFRIENTYTKGETDTKVESAIRQSQESIDLSVSKVEESIRNIKNQLHISLVTNLPTQQIYINDEGAFIPDYTEQSLSIQANAKLSDGTIVLPDCTWYRKISGEKQNLIDGEVVINNKLVISKNVLGLEPLITYICEAKIEVAGFSRTEQSEITINLVEHGKTGEVGKDGRVTYLHIKYSNDGGITFTEENGKTAGIYIGTYSDQKEEDSNDPTVYTWAKFKGDDASQVKIDTTSELFVVTKTQDKEVIITPNNIALTPNFINCEYLNWLYSVDGIMFNELVDVVGITEDSTTHAITITNDCELYDAYNFITFKACSNDSKAVDTMTIGKIIDNSYIDGQFDDLKDTLEQVSIIANTAHQQIDALNGVISSTVEEKATTIVNENMAIVDEKISEVAQTSDQFNISFTSSIKEINDYLDEQKKMLETNIILNENGITIKKSDSAFATVITNEKFAIMQDTTDIAYVNQNKMYITDAHILNSLTIGDSQSKTGFYKWLKRASGNFSLVYLENEGGS